MSYPKKETFDYSLSHRAYKYFTRNDPPPQEFDKEHPEWKYEHPDYPDPRALAPAFKNPIGDCWDIFITFQGYGMCADIEMKTFNCLEAYGLPQSVKKCADYMEDLYECASLRRQDARLEILRDERRRQFYAGERPYQYAVPPKLGIWSI